MKLLSFPATENGDQDITVDMSADGLDNAFNMFNIPSSSPRE